MQEEASPAEVRLRTAAATVACAWALNARPARSRQSRRPSLPPRQTRFGRQQQKLQTRLQQTCVLSRPPCTTLRRQAEDVEPSKEALTVRCSFTLSHCYFFLPHRALTGARLGEVDDACWVASCISWQGAPDRRGTSRGGHESQHVPAQQPVPARYQ